MQFNFLLGFSTMNVLPNVIVPAIVDFLIQVYIGQKDTFTAFKQMVTNNERMMVLTCYMSKSRKLR